MDTRIYSLLIGLFVLIPLLSGCGTMGARPDKGPQDPLAMADDLLPEAKLLDLWIEVLEARPLSEEQQESHGIRPEIREAESRFISVHLKNTLQKSGYWGAVRVVPKGTNGGEVIVRGEILESDGEKLVVRIQASDSRGHTWLDKTYQGGVEGEDYEKAARSEEDPFQHVYNAIANDLIRYKEGLAPDALADIRRIAELRFAAEFAPDAFGDYLTSSGGAYTIRRLPAEEDPMLLRIRGIRERDYMLIDTVNDHYDGYYRDLQDSYDNWRKFRQEEAENLRRVEREATMRKVIGVGLIVGAVALEMFTGVSARASTATLRSTMLMGGLWATKTGFDKDNEKQIHIDAMEELAISFESEATPMVVQVDGETHRLAGSAEDQYAKWRSLLHRIHATETALPASLD